MVGLGKGREGVCVEGGGGIAGLRRSSEKEQVVEEGSKRQEVGVSEGKCNEDIQHLHVTFAKNVS